MFRSCGFHEFAEVAIEQDRYRALTLLPRDEFNLFTILPTDLLHQVGCIVTVACPASAFWHERMCLPRATLLRPGRGCGDFPVAPVQFLEGFVARTCLLAVLLIMHTWTEKGVREGWSEQVTQRAGNKAFKLMLSRCVAPPPGLSLCHGRLYSLSLPFCVCSPQRCNVAKAAVAHDASCVRIPKLLAQEGQGEVEVQEHEWGQVEVATASHAICHSSGLGRHL